jgi:hypothetical protein
MIPEFMSIIFTISFASGLLNRDPGEFVQKGPQRKDLFSLDELLQRPLRSERL